MQSGGGEDAGGKELAEQQSEHDERGGLLRPFRVQNGQKQDNARRAQHLLPQLHSGRQAHGADAVKLLLLRFSTPVSSTTGGRSSSPNRVRTSPSRWTAIHSERNATAAAQREP